MSCLARGRASGESQGEKTEENGLSGGDAWVSQVVVVCKASEREMTGWTGAWRSVGRTEDRLLLGLER